MTQARLTRTIRPSGPTTSSRQRAVHLLFFKIRLPVWYRLRANEPPFSLTRCPAPSVSVSRSGCKSICAAIAINLRGTFPGTPLFQEIHGLLRRPAGYFGEHCKEIPAFLTVRGAIQ